MQQSDRRSNTVMFALLFGIAGLLIILAFLTLKSTQAEQFLAEVEITNIAPEVDTVIISTSSFGNGVTLGLDMVELGTTTVYVHGSYTDQNGCEDVTDYTVDDDSYLVIEFARSGVAGFPPDCDTVTGGIQHYDPLNCLIAANTSTYVVQQPPVSCAITNCDGGGDLSADYQCILDVEFFADATDSGTYSAQNWRATVFVGDIDSEMGFRSSTVEMNTLTALTLSNTTTIDYGTLALSDISADVQLDIRNSGNNAAMTVEISGLDMPCEIGTLDDAQQKMATSSGIAYASMPFTLSGVATDIGLIINKQQVTTTQAVSSTYWKLQVPATGVSGACQATTTLIGV